MTVKLSGGGAVPRSVREIVEQAEELARRFESQGPDPADRAGSKALAALHRAAMRRAQAEAEVTEAVRAARDHGQSWEAIGRRLGTSGEAARQRYGHPAEKR